MHESLFKENPIQLLATPNYFFFGFAWDKAEPATLFEVLLKRPSLSILEAFVATEGLVTLLAFFAIIFTTFLNTVYLSNG